MGSSDKRAKTRISVTMTRPYLDALDCLIDRGIYFERGGVIRQALRDLFRGLG